MPFRTNFFNEKIAQPGTSLTEIEEMIFDRFTPVTVNLAPTADLFLEGDETFKYGGELFFTIGADENTDEEDYDDVLISFDGFETLEDARAFIKSFGIRDSQINEVG